MKIKGEIGETVYVPVTIREIRIDTFGTRYVCDLPKDGISQTYDELEIQFPEDNVQKNRRKSRRLLIRSQRLREADQGRQLSRTF